MREAQAVNRFDTIDLLRGISILGVVLLHASLWLSFGDVHVGQSLPKWLRYVIFSQGGNGVSVFLDGERPQDGPHSRPWSRA